MTGEWKCEAPGLVPLLAAAQQAAAGFESVEFSYIPRAQNARVRGGCARGAACGDAGASADELLRAETQADALANKAMDTRASFDRVHEAHESAR
jgi:hypothetical protein